jgi:hypothetical protein
VTTIDVEFYTFDPLGLFSTATGGRTTYTGPVTPDGSATITDNGAGTDGLVLEDDFVAETATADISLNGVASSGSGLSAEESWTLLDTVTGETFQLVTFRVLDGPNAGDYTLSEIPLEPGRVYETVEFDFVASVDDGTPVFTYADYDFPDPDGVVDGTSGDDVINGSYDQDPDGDVIDGNDAPGGALNPQEFNWTDFADETNLAGGVSQDTGGINVDVSFAGGTGAEFSAEHTTQFVGGGEPFSTNSGAFLFQDSSQTDATVTFDFSAVSGSGLDDAVENVQFRINDIDSVVNSANNFEDIVTITAFGPDGNEVPVTITLSGDDTLDDQTITAALSSNSETGPEGSALIQIAGPVSQIIVTYGNGGDTQQAIYLSDLHFNAPTAGSNDDVVEAGAGNDIVDGQFGDDQLFGEAGDDTLTGGEGADLLDGGTGDDTLNTGSGDTALGGDGDDTFVIDPTQVLGGTITITGGEGDETTGDVLDFNGQLVPGSVVLTNDDDAAGGKSGTATLIDGTVVNFSEIESIICFASGTQIATPQGPRKIEDINPGDLVLTADHGPQPVRWHGRKSVRGVGDLAPVRFGAGTIGNDQPLLVSPQHRVLIDDYRSGLYFGDDEVLVAAKALLGACDVTAQPCARITYHHLLFDRHEVIWAEGAAVESYFPGDTSINGLEEAARAELFALFPELRSHTGAFAQTARPTIAPRAAAVLVG